MMIRTRFHKLGFIALLATVLLASCPAPEPGARQPKPEPTMQEPTMQEPAEPESTLPTGDFNDLGAAVLSPWGLWANDTTMWVANDDPLGISDKIFAYKLESKERDAAKDIDLASGNNDLRGIWSDGETLWAADNADDKLYAYNLAGDNIPGMEFDLATDNTAPRGLWSNGTTIWVADHDDDDIYAYHLGGDMHGMEDVDKKFVDLPPAGNNTLRGIWGNASASSPATTIWTSRLGSATLQAYHFDGAMRNMQDAAKDFTTLFDNGNTTPRGIWSNGTTMWVVNGLATNPKIYAYSLATREATPE